MRLFLLIAWPFATVAVLAAISQTVFTPSESKTWMIITDHSHKSPVNVFLVRTDASYTSCVSYYRPIVKKIDHGRWEITFTDELSKDLP